MDLERALTSGHFSPAVQAKALRIVQLGGVRQDPDYPAVFWVRSGSEAGREYRTEIHRHFVVCSCKHGLHSGSGASCAHPLAAMTFAKQHGIELPGPDAQELAAQRELPSRRPWTPDERAWDAELPEAPF